MSNIQNDRFYEHQREIREEPNMENQISFCCKMPIYGKGANEGLFCRGCNREITHTEYKDE